GIVESASSSMNFSCFATRPWSDLISTCCRCCACRRFAMSLLRAPDAAEYVTNPVAISSAATAIARCHIRRVTGLLSADLLSSLIRWTGQPRGTEGRAVDPGGSRPPLPCWKPLLPKRPYIDRLRYV